MTIFLFPLINLYEKYFLFNRRAEKQGNSEKRSFGELALACCISHVAHFAIAMIVAIFISLVLFDSS
ncbi:hypothetical protein FEK90_14565 [Escherichia coli]|nr:hypothetical protein [Escherichia coli]